VHCAIHTEKGAQPLGPYSQGIVAQGKLVFLSGQGPVDPQSGELQLGAFRAQAELTLNNVGTLLEAAGATWADVVKVTVFLADQANFAAFNEVYAQFVQPPYPARSTVEACLGQMGLEVDCIAVIEP
jgi:2-iminobutanoate/2-iminopropanoate deaminase